MKTTVKVMDLDVNIMDTQLFTSKIKEYLTDDRLNVILFATTKMLEEVTNDGEYREMLSRADLILPGEDTLLSMHHVDDLEAGGMVVDYKYFDQLMEIIKIQNETIYIVTQSESELDGFMYYCKRKHGNVSVVGEYIMKAGQNDEHMINEINSIAPSLLVLQLETPLQEKWIMENYTKLNAKICICTGGIMSNVMKEQKEVPGFLKILGLDMFFHKRHIHKRKKGH